MKLAVVTDSTAFLSDKIKNHPDLFIIPIPVILDGKIYNEGIDIEADAYYELLKNSKEFPTTSQPALGEALELYQHIASQGYDTIISIHLSSGISGFVRNLNTIIDFDPKVKIIPYDSKITSAPMGYMVETALLMAEQGQSFDKITKKIDAIRSSISAYMIVEDLNNLVRGGRLTNGAALVAGLLKIKPILTFSDGEIVLFEKIRSSKKAFARVEDLIGQRISELQQPVQVSVIHANNLQAAMEEKEKLENLYPEISVNIAHFGPVIGTHLGEKALGFTISIA
ncbi:DegV family protein [Enterococcus lemanii]|uniref:DegV family protein n=1 Tax=Enterococcus lemanii TaxID=1159752 RepID=A0ABV9MX12_9ENTE|nr:DegV family protein [Enterococcus lemanii]MBM7709495.1 DegV family protein with EDD domain [Enterococcus lemanii]